MARIAQHKQTLADLQPRLHTVFQILMQLPTGAYPGFTLIAKDHHFNMIWLGIGDREYSMLPDYTWRCLNYGPYDETNVLRATLDVVQAVEALPKDFLVAHMLTASPPEE